MPRPGRASRWSLTRPAVAVAIVAVCSACSFMFAMILKADPAAVACGVGVWAVIYAVVAAQPAFGRFVRRRGVLPALAAVYGVRVAVGIAAIVSGLNLFAGSRQYWRYVTVPDMWIGAWSLKLGQGFGTIRGSGGDWAASTAVTLLDGLIQQVPLAILFGVAWAAVRPFCRDRRDEPPRGFEVLPATPAAEV